MTLNKLYNIIKPKATLLILNYLYTHRGRASNKALYAFCEARSSIPAFLRSRKMLEDNGIIESNKTGRLVVYSLTKFGKKFIAAFEELSSSLPR